MMLALTGEGIMGKGPARPSIAKPAAWYVAKRMRGWKLATLTLNCQACGEAFRPFSKHQKFCSVKCRLRPCPADFEQVFIQIGRQLCEEWYRTNRRAITRWLEQCGKERLLKARRDFVRARYEAEREQRCLDMRMRAALRDRYANVAAVLTGEGEDGVGSGDLENGKS